MSGFCVDGLNIRKKGMGFLGLISVLFLWGLVLE